MRFIRMMVTILLVFAVAAPAAAGAPAVKGDKSPVPVFGTGAIEVRIYSDYFCPPCRKMEPYLELVLKDLLKRKVIRLVLVDFPMHEQSPLYARYFLFALKSKSDVDHALRVREILFTAAESKEYLTEEKLDKLFQKNKIPFVPLDPRPVFERYNALMTEDGINRTPTAVIVRGGKKDTLVGGADILRVLKELK